MERRCCSSCGGNLIKHDGFYICEFCGNKFEEKENTSTQKDMRFAVKLETAWNYLRDGDFEWSSELFGEIIAEDSKSHEAYWGRAHARNGIVYVTDYSDKKKVPTCNNITENSFLEDEDVKLAISLAPNEVKESYSELAKKIEKIRIEWLGKARKEPPYDVFISYKDSDIPNGIERTQDSIDAQLIYTGLVEAGYKVFYSRNSLSGKVSEQYEPYIYNAIKTASVMIVFGEKPEYFNAVWVKNEWKRFLQRINNGEKHKNSLVVVYKNMNPNLLPDSLKNRQAMDMGDLSFLENLKSHIKRVIEAQNQGEHLERIEITGGEMSKKSSQINQERLKTRDIGGTEAQVSIGNKQKLSLAKTYLNSKMWKEAKNLIDDVLLDSPNNAQAVWYGLYVKYSCSTDDELLRHIHDFDKSDYAVADTFFSNADRQLAAETLNKFYSVGNSVKSETYFKILNLILKYDYADRKARIKDAVDIATKNQHYETFELLLKTLDKKAVDEYIKYNFEYYNNLNGFKREYFSSSKEYLEYRLKCRDIRCIDNILSVDAGNTFALEEKLKKLFSPSFLREDYNKTLKTLLKYTKDVKQTVKRLLEFFINELKNEIDRNISFVNDVSFERLKELLKYYTDDFSKIKDLLADAAFVYIKATEKESCETKEKLYKKAEFFLSLVFSVDKNYARGYWGLCLIKLGVSDDKHIVDSDILLTTLPEYTKYLTLVGEERRVECIKFAAEQPALIDKRKSNKECLQEYEKLEKENDKRISRIKAKYRKERRLRLIIKLILSALSVIFAIVLFNVGQTEDGIFLLLIPIGLIVWFIVSKKYESDGEYSKVIKINRYRYYVVPSSYGSLYLKDCKFLRGVVAYDLTLYGKCSKVLEIGILEGAESIDIRSVFNGFEFVLPDTVTSFICSSECAFWCRVKFPNNISELMVNADSIAPLLVENGLKYAGNENNPYLLCLGPENKNMHSAIINYSCRFIANDAFEGSQISKVSFPDELTMIGGGAFNNCTGLKEVNIPKGVTEIFLETFKECTALETVNISDEVTFIGESAFEECRSLKNVKFSNKLTDIKEYAFKNCISLKKIEIPNGVTKISRHVFEGCRALTRCVLPNSLESIEFKAFEKCEKLTVLIIPEKVKNIDACAFYNKALILYCTGTPHDLGGCKTFVKDIKWSKAWKYPD